MKTFLKNLFRRRIKRLVIVKDRTIHTMQWPLLQQFCRDNQAVSLTVSEIDCIKILELGTDYRIFADKDIVSKAALLKLSKSKAGDIILLDKEEMDGIMSAELQEVGGDK